MQNNYYISIQYVTCGCYVEKSSKNTMNDKNLWLNYLVSQEGCDHLAFCRTMLDKCNSLVGWAFAAMHIAPRGLLL